MHPSWGRTVKCPARLLNPSSCGCPPHILSDNPTQGCSGIPKVRSASSVGNVTLHPPPRNSNDRVAPDPASCCSANKPHTRHGPGRRKPRTSWLGMFPPAQDALSEVWGARRMLSPSELGKSTREPAPHPHARPSPLVDSREWAALCCGSHLILLIFSSISRLLR